MRASICCVLVAEGRGFEPRGRCRLAAFRERFLAVRSSLRRNGRTNVRSVQGLANTMLQEQIPSQCLGSGRRREEIGDNDQRGDA